jgi:hypothetical protein
VWPPSSRSRRRSAAAWWRSGVAWAYGGRLTGEEEIRDVQEDIWAPQRSPEALRAAGGAGGGRRPGLRPLSRPTPARLPEEEKPASRRMAQA